MSADPLAAVVRRWTRARRRLVTQDARVLGDRLDERGCAFGRVTEARLQELSRAYERLEAKLNAVLLAVLATFVSTLVSVLVRTLGAGTP